MSKVKVGPANGLGTTDLVTMAEELARLVSEEGLHEVNVVRNGHRLRLRRRQGVRAPAPEAVAEAAPEVEAESGGVAVTSQVVGLFRPGKVQAGQRVQREQVLGTVESMSIRHELKAPIDGTLLEVLAAEGDPVEYGQALLLIAED